MTRFCLFFFRYVDENLEIQERNVTFLDLERLAGEHITRKILDFYQESGINPKQCRGQCYHGAPNLQSEKRKGLLVFSLKNQKTL